MILTTKEYYSALPIVGVLAISNGLILVKNSIDLGTLITKKTIYSTYIYLFSAAVNIIFLFVLVPKIGLIGVPISLLICYFTLVVFSWIVSEKLYYIGFRKMPFIISFLSVLLLIFLTTYFNLSALDKLMFVLILAFSGILFFYKKIRLLVENRVINRIRLGIKSN
jgi:O-antigen/teichoic acid export membrane protein